MLQAYISSISNVSEGMLQVFHMYVAKVDQDVVYVAMAIHMLQASIRNFHLFFQTYVASVFIWILHMFHTYIAGVLSICCICFAIAFSSVF